jgi:hypothetical protein
MHPKLHALDTALEQLQQAVPLPQEATFALEAIRANLRAQSVYVDFTTAILLAKLLRGLAIPHVDVK